MRNVNRAVLNIGYLAPASRIKNDVEPMFKSRSSRGRAAMRKQSRSLMLLALTAVASVSAAEQAVVNPNVAALLPVPVADMKTYNGNQCEAYHHWDIPNVQNQGIVQSAPIVGAGTHISGSLPAWVLCPIVRDNTTNIDGTLGVDVYIKNVAGQSYQCQLVSVRPNGTTVDSNTKSTTTAGEQTLVLDVNGSVNGGSYTLFCNLPSGAWLFSYRVRESGTPGVGTASTDNNN